MIVKYLNLSASSLNFFHQITFMVDPLTIISSFFQISSAWLHFPEILTMVIVPFFALMWFFKIFLYEKIRIFKNEFISWMMGILLAFLMTVVFKIGIIGVIIGIVGIVWFKVENIALRIILSVAIILLLLSLNTIISLITRAI
jgi:hypothetical protein